ncbi:MAG: class 1 fructose-bisphosphatase [Methylotenera sp.]|nr:class 1 fructose-bisphosphatase [Methylotenera sp.]
MHKLSLSQFLLEASQKKEPVTTELSPLLMDIAQACKEIALSISRGALQGTMGSLNAQNVQGETQKQLDVICNDIFIDNTSRCGLVAGMVSEELADIYLPSQPSTATNKYLLLFDPLDGSSNVNVNISVGTIFSVLRCPADISQPQSHDFLQAGKHQLCAGYALYGTSTIFVLSTGHGVNGFTLDTETGEFYLTHPDMQIPADTQEFAINMSNYRFWSAPMQEYINECLQGETGSRHKDFSMRWVASMVAEIHRILYRGGIFMYPADSKATHGKLRLLYEANPMSFIVKQAGGASSTSFQDILDIMPTSIHQRIGVVMGSKNEVIKAVSYQNLSH